MIIASKQKLAKWDKVYISHLGYPIIIVTRSVTKLPFPKSPTSRSLTDSNIIKKYDFLLFSNAGFTYARIVTEFRKIVDIVKKKLSVMRF